MKLFSTAACTWFVSAIIGLLPCRGQNVIAWGNSQYGKTTVPASATNVISVAAGGKHTVALRSNGTVVVWGAAVTTNVPSSATNVIAIAAGTSHSVALRADGTVVAWGDNMFGGQTNIPQSATNIIAIACGSYYTLALRADGTLVSWGSFSQNLNNASNFVGIAVSSSNGDAVAWRKDGSCKIFDTIGGSQTPPQKDVVDYQISGTLTCLTRQGRTFTLGPGAPKMAGVARYASSYGFNLYLMTDGTVKAWRSTSSSMATNIVSGLSNILAVSVGADHAAVVQGDGKPVILGEPAYGTSANIGQNLPFVVRALGGGPLNYQWLSNGVPILLTTNPIPSIPADINANGAEFRVVVSSASGQTTSGPVRVAVSPIALWGANSTGQCNFPAAVTNPVSISAGAFHGLALDRYGGVAAWGRQWKFPTWTIPTGTSATTVPSGLRDVAAIAGAVDNSMALRTDGTVAVWGRNFGNVTNVPESVTNVVAIAGGLAHCLALRGDGTLVSWGDNEYGQLDGASAAVNVTAIAAGYYHSLALRSDGTVIGFGEANVPPEATNIQAIAAGWSHSLALRRDGTCIAWGDNTFGQATVPPEATNLVAIKAGWYHNLALRSDGSVIGWGSGFRNSAATVLGGVRNISEIAVGEDFSVAISAFGPPRIARQIRDVHTHAGGLAILTAQIEGTNPMVIQWYHEAMPIKGANARQLVMTNVASGNAGSYFFHAQNSEGDIYSEPTTVTVEAAPSFQTVELSHNVLLGSGLCLSPEITGAQPMEFRWQLDGIDLADGASVSGSRSQTLCLSDAGFANGGVYTLIASNSAGVVTGVVANIAVTPILAWGDNSMGQLEVPRGASNAVSIASRDNHAFALKSDGKVVGWGDNSRMQNVIPEAVSNLVAVADGGNHGLGLCNDGKVVAWGGTPNSLRPTPDRATNIISIAAGPVINLALRADGTVVAWGHNGVTPEVLANSPVSLTNVVAVAAGESYDAVGLRSDGTLVVWGSGPLVSTWGTCLAGLSGVTGITAGSLTLAVLFDNGTITTYGQTSGSITTTTNTLTNVISIVTGTEHQMALESTGLIEIGGTNSTGQLNVPSSATNIVSIAAGTGHSLALQRAVSVERHRSYTIPSGLRTTLNATLSGAGPTNCQWFFGQEQLGSTGSLLTLSKPTLTNAGTYTVIVTDANGQTSSESIELKVLPQPSLFSIGAYQLATVGAPVSIAPVVCGEPPLSYQWQHNGTNISDSETVTGSQSPCLLMSASRLGDGGDYTLSLSNSYGQFSELAGHLDVTTVASWGETIGPVPALSNDVVAVAAGGTHNLALRVNGRVAAWGYPLQTNIPASATNIIAIAAGDQFSIALRSDGTVVGWGQSNPQVPATATNVVALAAGSSHCLALRADGSLIVWGSSSTTIPAAATNVVAIAAGSVHNLALRADGTVIAWSWSDYVSYPDIVNVPAAATQSIAICAGTPQNLALQADGTVIPWGSGTTAPISAGNIIALAQTTNAAFGLKTDGTVLALTSGTISEPVPTWLSHVQSISAKRGHCLALVNADGVRQAPSLKAGQSTCLVANPIYGTRSTYQWQFNGQSIAGATNPVHSVVNARWTNSGIYRVIVSNGFTSVTNPAFSLDVPRTQLAFDQSAFPALKLTNASGVGAVHLYGSTNLIKWDPVATTNSVLEAIEFGTPSPSSASQFYRASEE